MTDIIHIAQQIKDKSPLRAFMTFKRDCKLADKEDVLNSYYFAIDCPEKEGQVEVLKDIFKDHRISCEKIF